MAQQVKNSPAIQEMWVQPLGQEDPLEEEMAAPAVFVPEKSQERRSLVGYSYGVTRVGLN